MTPGGASADPCPGKGGGNHDPKSGNRQSRKRKSRQENQKEKEPQAARAAAARKTESELRGVPPRREHPLRGGPYGQEKTGEGRAQSATRNKGLKREAPSNPEPRSARGGKLSPGSPAEKMAGKGNQGKRKPRNPQSPPDPPRSPLPLPFSASRQPPYKSPYGRKKPERERTREAPHETR